MSGDKTEPATPPSSTTQNPSAEQKPTPEAKPDAKKGGNAKTEKKPGRKGGGGTLLLALLAFIVAAVALAASAWMYREQYMLPPQADPALASLKTNLSRLDQQQREVLSQVANQREALSQLRSDQQSQLAQLLNRSQALESQLEKLATVDRKDWLIAEAEYLLRLANQRLQLGRDAKSAAQLLASADSVLKEMDDAGLHKVRAELAKEIATLQNVADFDVEGVYLKLEGLGEALEALTLFTPPSYETEKPVAEDGNWQDRLASGFRRAWEKLSSYIRISHREDNFEPVLAPEQEAALRYSLRLMVEQAQMALLAERPDLYRRSLEQARDWLKKYYQLDDAVTAQLEQLDELLTLPLTRTMPDISASLSALKVYIDSRRWQQEVRG